MNLTETVTKAIKESLPALAANELSEFIDQAQRDKKLLEEHQEVVRKLSLSTVELADTINSLENKLKAYSNLENRERSVEKRENELAITLLKGDLTNAVKAKEDVYRLAEIAFKNPRLVHREEGNYGVPVPNGSYVSTAFASKVTTIEETK